MAHSGKYRVKNPAKYIGDHTLVIYRSMWEKYCMMHFDTSKKVRQWSSEEVIIPYFYEGDGRTHRYFPDFLVKWSDGSTSLIEVKPKKETLPPKGGKRTKRYINEAYTYVKNMNKWEAADEYCKDRKWKFEIWTEVQLEQMGIKPKSIKPLKPLKKLKPYSRKKTK